MSPTAEEIARSCSLCALIIVTCLFAQPDKALAQSDSFSSTSTGSGDSFSTTTGSAPVTTGGGAAGAPGSAFSNGPTGTQAIDVGTPQTCGNPYGCPNTTRQTGPQAVSASPTIANQPLQAQPGKIDTAQPTQATRVFKLHASKTTAPLPQSRQSTQISRGWPAPRRAGSTVIAPARHSALPQSTNWQASTERRVAPIVNQVLHPQLSAIAPPTMPSNPLSGIAQQFGNAVQQATAGMGQAIDKLFHSRAPNPSFGNPANPLFGHPNQTASIGNSYAPRTFLTQPEESRIPGGMQILVTNPVTARAHPVIEQLRNAPGYNNPELAGGTAWGQIIDRNGMEVFHVYKLTNRYGQTIYLGP